MPENSNVEVIDITNEREKLTCTKGPKGINLGGGFNLEAAFAEANIDAFTAHMRNQGGRVFLLKWEGGKVPRGAKVLDHEIAGIQNREVINSKYQGIGTYVRIVEFGGPNRKSHVIVVYLFSSASGFVV